MVKAQELRNQGEIELRALYQELSKELFTLRNEMKVTRDLKNRDALRIKRKDRARVMTILREKEGTA